ncbi:MAG TPA: hypothetical protein VL306_01830 [Methylomirabilota bacterium]|nr:hypothetical protein [Methylomirabilota bacterium]
MKFRTALITIVSIYALSLITLHFDLFNRFVNLDNVFHFSGGVSIGMLALAIRHFVGKKYRTTGVPVWFDFLFVVGFVFMVGVLWEFYEYIQDHTFALTFHWAISQPSVHDTLGDLMWDGIGAIIGFILFRKSK